MAQQGLHIAPGGTTPSRTTVNLALGRAARPALVAAGCGASHNPGVASIGKPTTTKAEAAPGHNVSGPFADALEFAHCMRSHGVVDFPDTQNPGGFPGPALARLDGRLSASALSEVRRGTRA